MKKIISTLLLGGLLVSMVMPMFALAQTTLPEGCTMRYKIELTEGTCPGIGEKCLADDTTKNCGMCCLMNTISTITNWMFYILMLVVTLMIIYGGFILLTGQGDPEKVGKGKGVITFAVIGLAVALVAKIVPSVVKFIMGV